MTNLLQVLVTGLGLGAAYALFANGVVLIYRGSGIVNFAQGGLGMLSAYLAFVELHENAGWPVGWAIAGGVVAAVLVGLAFSVLVLQRLARAAPITRLIATLGLLMVLQAAVERQYGNASRPVAPYLPHDTFDWGGVRVQEQVLYIIAVSVAITLALWLLVRYTRVGLAISAAAQSERAVQTLGWSPNLLSAFTWGLGAGLAGIAGALLAPLSGLSTLTFTLIVTVTGMAAALLGGFRSFPLTLLGAMVVGFGESVVTRYRFDIEEFLGVGVIPGLERAVPFLVILAVLVIRGRGLPLRSHVTDRLPRLGTGALNLPAMLTATGVVVALLFGVMDDRWAAATYVSATSAVIVLSIVVLTGYAGQLSLGQWALAGAGAFIAGNLVLRLDAPVELAVPLGILLTVPVGLLFALPALRTRGVNLAIVTLGLGFAIQAVVFTKQNWIAEGIDGGTRVGDPDIFGWPVDAGRHPHRWALVCIVAFVLAAVVVANLRRSPTGRRLIAVRTNERAAASLGISVFGVKLYAFAVASAIAGLAGILTGFRSSLVTYEQYSPIQSIFSVGWAVIGGIGYALGAVLSAPNAIGGLGTRLLHDVLGLSEWDALVGGVIVLLIVLTHQDGIAEVMAHGARSLASRLRRAPTTEAPRLPEPSPQPVTPATLRVEHLTVRFGGVVAVEDVSLEVRPGEVVGLIGPNGAGKTTLIDAVTGFVRPAAGTITLDGQPVDGWSATKRARHGLRRSFQSLELFEDVTVEDNIRAGSETAVTLWSWIRDLCRPLRPPLSDTAVAALHEFALEPHLHKLPTELPYGQRRLVGIARAVASGPSVVMLDEPAAGLDEAETRELATLIRRLADDRNMAVLLVEHDVNLVMSTCDRVVVLNFGAVIAAGTPAEIRSHPEVKLAYLGSTEEEPAVPPPAVASESTAASESVGSSQ